MNRYLKKRDASDSSLPEKVPHSPFQRAMDSANRRIFGNEGFRHRQTDIIDAIMSNEDVFVVMPTGGGKSLCFQLPAVLSKGVTIVVSPLLSLIEDQVSALLQLPCGGVPAAYLCSTCSANMESSIFLDLERADRGLSPHLKLLYVTPERLVNNIAVRDVLLRLYNNEMLSRFVIDEAHCVSSWGHDFRKDYKQLSYLKREFPEAPIVALTATARQRVMEDTMKILGIQSSARIFSAGFDRPNLYFEVRQKPASTGETSRQILAYIMEGGRRSETGIVYCMTKKDAESISDFLRENGIEADYYHAGQTPAVRKLVQAAWSSGQIKVVCATIAYGMGIDKPDVRYVLHMTLAKSLEGYYQEAGRAGRDNLRSECIMFYRLSDVNALSRLMIKPPAHVVSKADQERLEEMQEYCETRLDCRRKTFARYFGNASENCPPCRVMCDNCIRSFTPDYRAASRAPAAETPFAKSAYFVPAKSMLSHSVSTDGSLFNSDGPKGPTKTYRDAYVGADVCLLDSEEKDPEREPASLAAATATGKRGTIQFFRASDMIAPKRPKPSK